MKRPLAIVFIVVQIVLYAAAWRTVSPRESDFPAFYSAARLWHEGANPYDLEQQCGKQIPIRGEPCLPFAHPPVLLPLVSLISSDDFVGSYHRWTIVLLCVVLLCLIPFYKISRQWQVSIQSILFLPIVIALALGQDTPFILLAVLCWLWLLGERKDFLAGLVVSLSVLKPQIAILLGVPLLFSRPKAFGGFVVGGFAFLLLSFALVGKDGFSGLLQIVRVMSHGEGFGVNPAVMISVTGLLSRVGLSASWSWIFFALALVAISVLWRRLGTTPSTLSAGIALALFCAPHSHLHDLALLSGPILFIHPLAPVAVSAFLAAAYAFSLQQWAAYVLLGLVVVRSLPQRRKVAKEIP
jgi:hypothetical protein